MINFFVQKKTDRSNLKNKFMKKQKVWFITGASKGFGLEIAKAALAAGDKVVGTVRNNAEGLESALRGGKGAPGGDLGDGTLPGAGGETLVVTLDVTKEE
jgi:NAD(P)-dependent dehydrogenase (short-subunit alcohol dehydrogenase family)